MSTKAEVVVRRCLVSALSRRQPQENSTGHPAARFSLQTAIIRTASSRGHFALIRRPRPCCEEFRPREVNAVDSVCFLCLSVARAMTRPCAASRSHCALHERSI